VAGRPNDHHRRSRTADQIPAPDLGGPTEEGTLNGLWYMAMGTGRPVVYLPGFGPHNRPLTGIARRASATAIRWLARDCRVYWLNRRVGLKRGATVADLAADYAGAIQAGFPGSVDVVGYSMGGMIGLQLAADHPQRVRRLVVGGITQRLAPIEAAAIRQ
jgi:pimeloyl-ACP methyl ester carboxylesterase